jgi:hypothetical protein
MRELITAALDKLEEITRQRDRLEEAAGGWTVEEHNNYIIWGHQKEEIRQAIIEYALAPASQTAHSILESVGEEAISFAQVQVNKG